MKAFRMLLEQSELTKSQQRLCAGVLGRHLKGKSRAYALKLYEKLRSVLGKLRVAEWVRTVQDLCRWFMGLIKVLLKPKPMRKQFKDYNEYLWEHVKREKERVMARRRDHEKTWEEKYAEWLREREAERAWRKKQYELGGQRLRSQLTGHFQNCHHRLCS